MKAIIYTKTLLLTKILFGFMKTITTLKINFFIFLFFFSNLLSFDINLAISQVFKDSINFTKDNLLSLNKDNADYIFLDALIEFNGDSASAKYQKFYYKYPQHIHADYAVYEIGSYYYSKGYYINSSSWFKKIPIHYHKSKLMEKSIEMFFNSMVVSGFADSLSYYGNIFSKLYPNLDIGSYSINFPYELKFDKEATDIKYTIQTIVHKHNAFYSKCGLISSLTSVMHPNPERRRSAANLKRQQRSH